MKFYAETGIGCCIRTASTIEAARKQLIKEVGTYNDIQLIRPATQEDITWVTAMRGSVDQ